VWNRRNILLGLVGLWHGAKEWKDISIDLGFVCSNDGINFREPAQLQAFIEEIVPDLMSRKPIKKIRIWSAGCSSGEEVYTIAMCLLGPDRTSATWLRNADVRLLATDIAPHVVESVKRGFYADGTVEGVPQPRQATHCHDQLG